MDIKYNVERKLSSYNRDLKVIRKHGFIPIAVAQMYFEETFVFKTKKEALEAYHLLERGKDEKWIGKVVGWWYSKKDFLAEVKRYETAPLTESKVQIFWLDNK